MPEEIQERRNMFTRPYSTKSDQYFITNIKCLDQVVSSYVAFDLLWDERRYSLFSISVLYDTSPTLAPIVKIQDQDENNE